MLVGFGARNHRQQVARRGAVDAVDDRRTPRWLFDELGVFDLDAAASEANALCPRFWTREQDALTQPWTGRVFCNPPYSDLAPWLAKAWAEWRAGRVSRLVMLVPANRCEQRWWQEYVEPYRDRPDSPAFSPLSTRFLPGRLRFDMPADWPVPAKGNRPPFGIAVLEWNKARVEQSSS